MDSIPCDEKYDNYEDKFYSREWVAVDDLRKWLKEEIHRAGAPSQMLKEFDESRSTLPKAKELNGSSKKDCYNEECPAYGDTGCTDEKKDGECVGRKRSPS